MASSSRALAGGSGWAGRPACRQQASRARARRQAAHPTAAPHRPLLPGSPPRSVAAVSHRPPAATDGRPSVRARWSWGRCVVGGRSVPTLVVVSALVVVAAIVVVVSGTVRGLGDRGGGLGDGGGGLGDGGGGLGDGGGRFGDRRRGDRRGRWWWASVVRRGGGRGRWSWWSGAAWAAWWSGGEVVVGTVVGGAVVPGSGPPGVPGCTERRGVGCTGAGGVIVMVVAPWATTPATTLVLGVLSDSFVAVSVWAVRLWPAGVVVLAAAVAENVKGANTGATRVRTSSARSRGVRLARGGGPSRVVRADVDAVVTAGRQRQTDHAGAEQRGRGSEGPQHATPVAGLAVLAGGVHARGDRQARRVGRTPDHRVRRRSSRTRLVHDPSHIVVIRVVFAPSGRVWHLRSLCSITITGARSLGGSSSARSSSVDRRRPGA